MGGPSIPSYSCGVFLALDIPTGPDSHRLAHLPLRPQPLTAQHSHGLASVLETQGLHNKEPRLGSQQHTFVLSRWIQGSLCVVSGCVCLSGGVSVCLSVGGVSVCLLGCVSVCMLWGKGSY